MSSEKILFVLYLKSILLWNSCWSNYNIIKRISYPWIALDNKIWIPAQSLLSTKWCCFLYKLSINKVTFITFVFEIQLFLVLSSRNLQQTQATNENHRYDIYWYCNTLLLQVFRIKSDSSQTSNSHRYPIKDIVEANPLNVNDINFLYSTCLTACRVDYHERPHKDHIYAS